MHECLGLRDKYVFREKIPPWEKEEITEPGTPVPNPEPFFFKPEIASSVCVPFESFLFRVQVIVLLHFFLFKVSSAPFQSNTALV